MHAEGSRAARRFAGGPALAAIAALAAVLRFWRLASKPLWLDEIITALVCFGRGPSDVPVDVVARLSRVPDLMSPRPGAGWAAVIAILKDPAVQHTHPPLFYLLMNAWYRLAPPSFATLAWDLRVVPALLGVAAVAAMYGLLRTAFPPRPGVAAFGAAAMAVSPLMLLVSQEARNYTLPALLLVVALWLTIGMAGTARRGGRIAIASWTWWVAVNAAGCYAHYYMLLAVAAEVAALAVALLRAPSSSGGPARRPWVALGVAAAAVAALFAPWIPTLAMHVRSPEQRWMALSDPVAFATSLVNGPLLTIVAGPGESRPPWIAVSWTAIALAVAAVVAVGVGRGLARAWADAESRPAVEAAAVFSGALVAELVGASLVLGRNFLIAPRYSFVYYPGLCLLVAAGALALPRVSAAAPAWRRVFGRRAICGLVLASGTVSGVLSGLNLTFEKSFFPRHVADNMTARPADLVVFGYNSYHEICVGLSYLVALEQTHRAGDAASFAFVRRSTSYEAFWHRAAAPAYLWRSLSGLPRPAAPPAGFWIVAPGLVRDEFPSEFRPFASGARTCALDRSAVFETNNNVRGPAGMWSSRRPTTARGVEYAFYRCDPAERLW